jgi:hypothetical protein
MLSDLPSDAPHFTGGWHLAGAAVSPSDGDGALELSSDESGSQVGQITCGPCSLEVEKIKTKINNRKLSDIKDDEVISILTPFKY